MNCLDTTLQKEAILPSPSSEAAVLGVCFRETWDLSLPTPLGDLERSPGRVFGLAKDWGGKQIFLTWLLFQFLCPILCQEQLGARAVENFLFKIIERVRIWKTQPNRGRADGGSCGLGFGAWTFLCWFLAARSWLGQQEFTSWAVRSLHTSGHTCRSGWAVSECLLHRARC